MIYRVFTDSSQAPFVDLQGFYRVKSGPLFRFTGFLQSQVRPPFSIYRVFHSQVRPPFSIYRVFTESSQAPFYDLQGFYRVKFVLLFQFTGVLQQTVSWSFWEFQVFFYMLFT